MSTTKTIVLIAQSVRVHQDARLEPARGRTALTIRVAPRRRSRNRRRPLPRHVRPHAVVRDPIGPRGAVPVPVLVPAARVGVPPGGRQTGFGRGCHRRFGSLESRISSAGDDDSSSMRVATRSPAHASRNACSNRPEGPEPHRVGDVGIHGHRRLFRFGYARLRTRERKPQDGLGNGRRFGAGSVLAAGNGAGAAGARRTIAGRSTRVQVPCPSSMTGISQLEPNEQ